MTNRLKILYGILIIMGILIFLSILLNTIILFYISGLIVGFSILSFSVYIIFNWVIPGISKWVSRLCTYHKLATIEDKTGETIWKKIFLVFICNFVLTIPILATILYILNPSAIIISDKLGLSSLDIAVIVSLSIIPGLLLVLRLVGNPTRDGIFWKIHDFTIITVMNKYKGPLQENGVTPPAIRKIKDDISSFFSTLIFGTLLFLFIQYCSDYVANGSNTQFFARYSTSIPPIILFCYVVAYIATLVIATAIGESILKTCVPVDQV